MIQWEMKLDRISFLNCTSLSFTYNKINFYNHIMMFTIMIYIIYFYIIFLLIFLKNKLKISQCQSHWSQQYFTVEKFHLPYGIGWFLILNFFHQCITHFICIDEWKVCSPLCCSCLSVEYTIFTWTASACACACEWILFAVCFIGKGSK